MMSLQSCLANRSAIPISGRISRGGAKEAVIGSPTGALTGDTPEVRDEGILRNAALSRQ